VSWQLVYAKHALKDAPKLSAAGDLRIRVFNQHTNI
jgi:hypothetical protein